MEIIAHSQPSLGTEEASAAAKVVESGYLAYGPQCHAFEEELASYFGRRHAVVMSNGHAALEVYLESLNLDGNSPVVIPSYACAALRHAVHRSGLRPILKDVEQSTLGLGETDPAAGAVVAANMFAVPCRAAETKGYVLEDCAMGAIPGKTATRSHAALLSFYVTKMLTTGQGGALLTDDENLADEWRCILQYDNQSKYRAVSNRHLTDIQAAIGRVQLKRYQEFLEKRKNLFACYHKLLTERGLKLHPMVNAAADKILFRLPLLVNSNQRDPLIDFLKQKNVEAKKPVWQPLHVEWENQGDVFPVTESADQSIVSLPFYPNLTQEQALYIVDSVNAYLGK